MEKYGIFIVGLFLIVNLLLGLWSGRNVKNIKDYAIGNKRWGVGALVMTYIATAIGGGTLFRDCFSAYEHGFILFLAFFGISISNLLRGYLIASRINFFSKCTTLGDVLETLYGKNEKILGGIASFLCCIVISSVQIKSLSLVLENFLNLSGDFSIIISGLTITLYTSFGGMRGVVATDILQFIFLFGSFFILTSYSIFEIGGLNNLFKSLESKYIFHFNLLPREKLQFYIGTFLGGFLFSYDLIFPPRIQRVLMCDSQSKIKKVFLYSGFGHAIAHLMITLIGLSAIIFLPNAKSGVDIMMHLYKNIVPSYFQPIIVVGMISIIFSTGDSFLHSAGISIMNDIIKPIRGKNFSINSIKFSVIMVGIISIIFSIKFSFILSKLQYLYGCIVPILAVPVFFGFLGIKSTKKIFWIASFSGFITYIYLQFFSEYLRGFSLFGSMLINAIVFLNLQYLKFKKIITIKKDFSENLIKNTKFKNFNLLQIIEKSTKLNRSPYVLFGIFSIINISLPYLLSIGSVSIIHRELVFLFRTIGIILSALLITHSIWPSVLKKYLPIFWYITLIYCLPFLSTTMLLISGGAIEYTINIAINIMFLLLLVDWISAILIGIIGTFSSIAFFKFFIQNGDTPIILNFETKYLLFYQIIFGTIIGLLFARKKYLKIKSLDQTTNFLQGLQENIIETNNMSLAIANDANARDEKIIFNPSENIKNIKNILQEKNFFSKDLSEKISELETFIAAEEKNISPYMVLNVAKIKLYEIAEKFKSFSKYCGTENTSLSIYCDDQILKCDSSQIIKCIGTLSKNFYQKMKNFYDEDSDIFLNISILEKKITCVSQTNKNIFREIDCIAIVLSENETFFTNLQDKNFEKVMSDPEKIPSTRLEDHQMIDVKRTIDAHYGILEVFEDEESLSYICILPKNVYDIRPITLDLNSPNVKDLSYNYPEAEKLENKFFEKISDFEVCQNKIKKAVDYIKIYHRHQTRKSGEPYYLHPINVAMIAIDIAKEASTKIHDFLMKNIEKIIIVSLLHDILEDTYIKKKNILQNFGSEILSFIESITKTDFEKREFLLSNDLAFFNLINEQPIVVCVKIADRIHNLKTIDGHSKIEKRKKIAEETISFFIKVAEKYEMKNTIKKLSSMSSYIIQNGKIEGYKD